MSGLRREGWSVFRQVLLLTPSVHTPAHLGKQAVQMVGLKPALPT